MIYAFASEYGGKAFLKEYFKFHNLKINLIENISTLRKKIQDSKKNTFYICPGGELGKGKENIREAILNGHYVIGLVDHFTNPWQRFSDELTGEILKYKPNKIVVRSDKCLKRLREYGFKEKIEIHKFINKKFNNYRGQSLKINDKKIIIVITEWYSIEKKFKLDQADPETLNLLMKNIKKIAERNKNLFYGIKLHPKLMDDKVSYSEYSSSESYLEINKKNNQEIFEYSPIFIGIDSNYLIKAINNNCLVYSWHKEKSSFKISDYVNDIIELKNIEDIEWE